MTPSEGHRGPTSTDLTPWEITPLCVAHNGERGHGVCETASANCSSHDRPDPVAPRCSSGTLPERGRRSPQHIAARAAQCSSARQLPSRPRSHGRADRDHQARWIAARCPPAVRPSLPRKPLGAPAASRHERPCSPGRVGQVVPLPDRLTGTILGCLRTQRVLRQHRDCRDADQRHHDRRISTPIRPMAMPR